MKKKVILLVDDIPEYLDIMELNLPEGTKAIPATTRTDAQAIIAGADLDAAVLDVRLSEDQPDNRDGLDLMNWIHDEHPKLPVIVISAYREFEFEAEALALGAHRFLRKPIQPDLFRAALEEILKEAS